MLSHASIWKAIDRLASLHKTSPSGLARLAGLDPTAFNPSKRFKANGKPRWPSTESIAKILEATKASPSSFFADCPPPPSSSCAPPPSDKDRVPLPAQSIPLWLSDAANVPDFVPFEEATASALEASADQLAFPAPMQEPVYAILLCTSCLEPHYQCGDTLLVSPSARLRQGDRLLIKDQDGRLSAHQLLQKTMRSLIVRPIGAQGEARSDRSPDHDKQAEERVLSLGDLLWHARILWVSQ